MSLLTTRIWIFVALGNSCLNTLGAAQHSRPALPFPAALQLQLLLCCSLCRSGSHPRHSKSHQFAVQVKPGTSGARHCLPGKLAFAIARLRPPVRLSPTTRLSLPCGGVALAHSRRYPRPRNGVHETPRAATVGLAFPVPSPLLNPYLLAAATIHPDCSSPCRRRHLCTQSSRREAPFRSQRAGTWRAVVYLNQAVQACC